jgi:heat shock protein HtpX
MFLFVLLVAAIAWVVSYWTGWGPYGVAVAAVIAILMAWGSYFSSDKIALSMSRAKPADETEYAQLHNIVDGLAIAAGITKPRVYIVEDPAPNAFATGRNEKHAAIAVTTGLLSTMNRDELEGVIAHELSHIQNRDILVMTIAVTLVGIVVLLGDFFMRAMWLGGGRRGNDREGGGPAAIFAILGIVLLILAPVFAQLLQFAISRRREFLADTDAVFLTRHPEGMIGALEKLKGDDAVVRTASRATAHLWIESPIQTNASEGRKHTNKSGAWLNRLFQTHPPLDERIEALRSLTPGMQPTPRPA